MSGIAQADAHFIPLADQSVSMVVTSPPYYGLRKYEGQVPTVWGGDAGCSHPEWQSEVGGLLHENRNFRKGTQEAVAHAGPLTHVRGDTLAPSDRCTSCGAWRGLLGLEATPQQYVANLVEVCREIRRVLRPHGLFWLNLSDSYASTNAGNRHGLSSNLNRSQKRIGAVRGKSGNLYRRIPEGLKSTDLIGIPWSVAFALRDDGWWLRRDIIWNKTNGMPEPAFTHPASSHEYVFMLSRSRRYYYDWFAVRESGLGDQERQRRSVWDMPTASYEGAHYATFPPMLPELCLLAGTSERGECPVCRKPWTRVVERLKNPNRDMEAQRAESAERTGRTDGHVSGPEGLIDEVRHVGWKSGCNHTGEPVPAAVLDPFFGSGTTGEVARVHGRRFIGLDLSLEYLDKQAKPRALQAMPSDALDNLPLFGGTNG